MRFTPDAYRPAKKPADVVATQRGVNVAGFFTGNCHLHSTPKQGGGLSFSWSFPTDLHVSERIWSRRFSDYHEARDALRKGTVRWPEREGQPAE